MTRINSGIVIAESGAACLQLILHYYHNKKARTGISHNINHANHDQKSLWDIGREAEKAGFRARVVQVSYQDLMKQELGLCILTWENDNFLIRFPGAKWRKGIIPVGGHKENERVQYGREEFIRNWTGASGYSEKSGIVLLIEPVLAISETGNKKAGTPGWSAVYKYFKKKNWLVAQILFSLLITTVVQLMFPFLMQSIIDVGINTKNLGYIGWVVIAQVMLVFSRTLVQYVRGHLLLFLSTKINLSILSDFWIKLCSLPVSYFDGRQAGTILQRVQDSRLLQNFMTGPVLNTLFSALNFIVFSVVMILYSAQLFLVFVAGIICYLVWLNVFKRMRRDVNYQIFNASAIENNTTLQLIQGMQEIRLLQVEQVKRWEWEHVQVKLFKLNIKKLSIDQIQEAGAIFINQGKDVLITFIIAGLAIKGELTIGAIMAIQYVIAQLSIPLEQLVGFVQNAQDARISMERLRDVYDHENEEKPEMYADNKLPRQLHLRFENVSFYYPGTTGNNSVLKNISLEIPEGKVTALVGVSGSGKSTLLKLLLKFYNQYEGTITIGGRDLQQISPSYWRKQCGAVLQDGFIFNDTIAGNIAAGCDSIDHEKLVEASRMANILPFIESLPEGFNTLLGAYGTGLSQGQKQRLLIARVIYRNPLFVFFDESTNALDANNEKVILENLQDFFRKKTVIIVAHRLSTVKNADKIVVLENGEIIEQGDHHALSRVKGKYFELVKNQLELGI